MRKSLQGTLKKLKGEIRKTFFVTIYYEQAMEPKIITNISDGLKGFLNIFKNTGLVTKGSAAWVK